MNMEKLKLQIAKDFYWRWAQRMIEQYHYLRTPVHPASRPLTYVVTYLGMPVGCLIFGRGKSTRCYTGRVTYGSTNDVAQGRATYTRWEVLNLMRFWLSSDIQYGGKWCKPYTVPGYFDRTPRWRSTAASTVMRCALQRVGYDYLWYHPPVWVDQPYQIRVVVSYCDTRYHRGTIYKASGFDVDVERRGKVIDRWSCGVDPLTNEQDEYIRKLAEQSLRSRTLRSKVEVEQSAFEA